VCDAEFSHTAFKKKEGEIMLKREKRLIGSLMVLFFLVGILFVAGAQAGKIKKPADYPKRKIEWNLWYGPGGGTDIFSRTIGIPARRYLKPAPLVIINIDHQYPGCRRGQRDDLHHGTARGRIHHHLYR
jgi:hypothetical protein